MNAADLRIREVVIVEDESVIVERHGERNL
jgi:hypothetical protein